MILRKSMNFFRLVIVLLLSQNLILTSALQMSANNWGGWRVALDIGREPFTTMPKSWGSSGARFPLVIKCNFTDDNAVGSISGDVRFTAAGGEVIAPVEPGTWSLSNNRDLSFTLTFPEQMERNGVEIGPCTISCEGLLYTKEDLKALDEEFYRVRAITDKSNADVKEMKSRREAPKKWNFETNRWEKRYKDESIFLNVGKRLKQAIAINVEKIKSEDRPNPSTLSLEPGEFPGIDCDVFISRNGKVKMKGGNMGGDIIGTWRAEPINDNAASYYRPSY